MTGPEFFTALHARIEDRCDALNRLDAALGDGDHGTTMLRGLTRAAQAESGVQAKAFMRASGGASGTLFGLILLEVERHLNDGEALGAGLRKACDRIMDLGQVNVGDKSMVDALDPAVTALETGTLQDAIAAAAAGRDGTRELSARRGRAQYVENGGQGHVDPGAVSVVIILETLAGKEGMQ
tara:strand:+ start:5729 stop:6274 length:546 start_codon:yes stop_codon:yes gene_type:complete